MQISLFHSFFIHKFFVFNNNFWSDILKIESVKIVPISLKNDLQATINNLIATKPFYVSLRILRNVYFYTKFIKKNKSFKSIFLIFKFYLDLRYLNGLIFDIIFFWRSLTVTVNKIYKLFRDPSVLNYFLILRESRRVVMKHTYINFFHLDFNYLVTNATLVFYFKHSLDFMLFLNFFKTLFSESFFFSKKLINEKA